jgi:hypothetical protein
VDDQRESADAIDREVEYLNRLVTNLLDLSRIEAGALRAERDAYEFDDLVGQTVDRLRSPKARSPPIDRPAAPLLCGRLNTGEWRNGRRAGAIPALLYVSRTEPIARDAELYAPHTHENSTTLVEGMSQPRRHPITVLALGTPPLNLNQGVGRTGTAQDPKMAASQGLVTLIELPLESPSGSWFAVSSYT